MLFLLALISSVFAESYFESMEDDVVIIPQSQLELDWVDMSEIDAGTWCDICQEVANFAEDLIIEHGSPALKNLIYTKLCDRKSGVLADVCKSATDKVIELAIDLVKKYVSADKVCVKAKLC